MNGRWTDFPQPPKQDAVCNWWFNLQDELLSNKRGVYYTSASKNLTGSEAERQIDLFVKSNDEKLSKLAHDWKDVEVIGELKESNDKKKATLLQISRYVRDVFSSQPTRRYVHAFTLCGNEMRHGCSIALGLTAQLLSTSMKNQSVSSVRLQHM